MHFSVLFGMRFGRMLRVIAGVGAVRMRQVRMVGCRLVVPGRVMVGGFVVVVCSLLMMVGCLPVMMRCSL